MYIQNFSRISLLAGKSVFLLRLSSLSLPNCNVQFIKMNHGQATTIFFILDNNYNITQMSRPRETRWLIVSMNLFDKDIYNNDRTSYYYTHHIYLIDISFSRTVHSLFQNIQWGFDDWVFLYYREDVKNTIAIQYARDLLTSKLYTVPREHNLILYIHTYTYDTYLYYCVRLPNKSKRFFLALRQFEPR